MPCFNCARLIHHLGCGGTVNVDDVTGFMNSPHYPTYYEETECIWIFKTSAEKKITLTFIDFDIEYCSKCRCDALEVNIE